MTLTTLARPVSTPRSRLHLLTMMRQLNDDAEALLTGQGLKRRTAHAVCQAAAELGGGNNR